MERPVAETMPEVMVFWNWPRALPMAMTCWPAVTVLESPRVTVGRSETLLM